MTHPPIPNLDDTAPAAVAALLGQMFQAGCGGGLSRGDDAARRSPRCDVYLSAREVEGLLAHVGGTPRPAWIRGPGGDEPAQADPDQAPGAAPAGGRHALTEQSANLRGSATLGGLVLRNAWRHGSLEAGDENDVRWTPRYRATCDDPGAQDPQWRITVIPLYTARVVSAYPR